jgi:metal-responsive CopG/Arc/MetJ family transcriptional regulator
METIRVVLDAKLLRAADRIARKFNQNRSALIRDALREHIRRLEINALVSQDRQGYLQNPDTGGDSLRWAAVASWPAK